MVICGIRWALQTKETLFKGRCRIFESVQFYYLKHLPISLPSDKKWFPSYITSSQSLASSIYWKLEQKKPEKST